MYLLCDIDGVHIPFPGPNGEIPLGFEPQHVAPTGYPNPVKVRLNPTTGRLLLAAFEAIGRTRPRQFAECCIMGRLKTELLHSPAIP